MLKLQINHSLKTTLAACVLCAVTATLAQGQTATEPSGAEQESFPELSKSYLKTGDFVNPGNVRIVELGAAPRGNANTMKGMNKDQIRSAIGSPHFSEGLGDNKVWHYLFNFYTPAATVANPIYMTCQFKIKFNDDSRIESTHWKDQACTAFTNANTQAVAAAPLQK